MKLLLAITVLNVLICLAFAQSHSIIDADHSDNLQLQETTRNSANVRSFIVDYDNDQFLMDGKPFRFVSGSFHYFRALPETWQDKLRTMRAGGLNAVVTYIEWSLHNPKDGTYVWNGMGDLVRFVELAAAEDLYVILRPGPYICAERDMGGFPYWLLTKYPTIKLRTFDRNYINEVRIWYEQLMPQMEPLLYGNGGPIIMVQVENEYGSFYTCDKQYQNWLRDETEKYVKGQAVLFTNDGPDQVRCGKIEGVLATLDFGASAFIDSYWRKLRQYQPKGPLVNAEYYPGWLTHWQEKMQRVSTRPIVQSLEHMLNQNASVNFYMYFGGTNFGYTAGANDGGPGSFNADVTSYDYDAPMDESGDPTPKLLALRDSIAKYLPRPNVTVPEVKPKMALGNLELRPIGVLLSSLLRQHLTSPSIISRKPITFEAYNQFSGFLLYEAALPKRFKRDPALLKVDKLRDRASIFVDRILVGMLSRENKIAEIPITSGLGDRLQILVENQGRINFNIPNDFKGILGDVTINGDTIYNWTMTGFPMDNYQDIQTVIDYQLNQTAPITMPNRALLKTGPTMFYGTFDVNATAPIYDTYLDPTNWGKGIAFVNGFNLGRYWPAAGPQITLYVPKEILKPGENKLVLIEIQKAPANGTISFTNVPNLDGYK